VSLQTHRISNCHFCNFQSHSYPNDCMIKRFLAHVNNLSASLAWSCAIVSILRGNNAVQSLAATCCACIRRCIAVWQRCVKRTCACRWWRHCCCGFRSTMKQPANVVRVRELCIPLKLTSLDAAIFQSVRRRIGRLRLRNIAACLLSTAFASHCRVVYIYYITTSRSLLSTCI